MIGSNRTTTLRTDGLLRWLVGVGVGLVAIHVALALVFQPGQIIMVIPWYVPMVHSLVVLAALSVAFLSFGRYQVLREPAAFWIGTACSSFAVFAVFYVVSYPGLTPSERVIVAQLLNTAAWYWHLQFSVLAIFLLAALVLPWPRAGTTADRWWLLLITVLMVAFVLIGLLLMAIGPSLPLLVVDEAWSMLNSGWIYALLLAFAAGVVASARRYRQSGNVLLGYVALTELILAFAMLVGILGGRFYTLWWYWQRVLWVGGFCVLLFGLLSEYVGLYRREQGKTRELEVLQQEAQEERNRLRVLIDTAPIGIAFRSAPDGRLKLFNKAAEVVMGRPLALEVPLTEESSYYGIFRPNGEAFPAAELPASRSLRGDSCVGVEMLIRQPSGREVNILANSAPLHDAEGHIIGAVVALLDITAIKEQQLLRDEFISTAAHELRTPVTTIKGYAQAMSRWAPGGHEPREGQALEVINAQCDRINRRVQEMLEAVRFRRVAPELYRVRFDLGDLAYEAMQRMQATTQLHRLTFRREGAAPVEADRERIEEVLVSLLDNAIKFSPMGGDIEVRVCTEAGEAVVAVRDYGVGIAKERQPHVFEPFYEAVPAGAVGYRGVVALSLYLSKIAIERHKGRVWFESEEGKGSTFYLALPLAQ